MMGNEFRVNDYTFSLQDNPDVLIFPDGRFLISWTSIVDIDSFDGRVIAAQLYDAQGSRIGNNFVIDAAVGQDFRRPHMSLLDDGGFVVVYEGETGPGGLPQDLYFRIFNSDLTERTTTRLRADSLNTTHERAPHVIGLDDGGFMVFSTVLGAGAGFSDNVFGRAFNANGTPRGPEFQLNVTANENSQKNPFATRLENGNIVVIWDSEASGVTPPGAMFSTDETRAAIIDSNGNFVRTDFVIDPSSDGVGQAPYTTDIAITALTGGGFAVSFYRTRPVENSDTRFEIVWQKFNNAGNPVSNIFTAYSDTEGFPDNSGIQQLANGNILVTWDAPNPNFQDTFSRIFTVDGVPLTGETLLPQSTVDDQEFAVAGVFADGGYVVTYESRAIDPSSTGIAARIFGRSTPDNDTLTGSLGADSLNGGAGNDVIFALGGNDTLVGGLGQDALFGGTGADRVLYTDAASGLIADLILTSRNTGEAAGDTYSSIELVYGSAFGDELRGTQTNNVIAGNNGNDALFGRNGNDAIYGGAGNDQLDGGVGADGLFGGSGTDRVLYNTAPTGLIADLILTNRNTGDAAGDTYSSIELVYGSAFGDELRGTQTNNVIAGNGGNDQLYGRGGNDDIFGGSGNDVLDGGAGADDLFGGSGTDRVLYNTAPTGLIADLILTNRNTGDAAGDTYSSIELVYGSAFGDELRGTQTNNVIAGNGGNDQLYGRGGDDDIFGGSGNDVLDGGAGADDLFGGSGADRVLYNTAATGLIADLILSSRNTGDAAGDTYSSIELVYGSAFGDELRGTQTNNVIAGNGGNDQLYGRGGNDDIFGGSGNDVIEGGAGADDLFGGSGADQFFFLQGAGADTVHDFQNNVDTLMMDDALWNGTRSVAQVLSDFGTVTNGSAVFDFGSGQMVRVNGVSNLNLLIDDITII